MPCIHVLRTAELQLQHPDFATVFGTLNELYHLIETLLVAESYPVIWVRTENGWNMIFDGWPQDLKGIHRYMEEHCLACGYDPDYPNFPIKGNYDVVCRGIYNDSTCFHTDDIEKARYWESKLSEANPDADFWISTVDTGFPDRIVEEAAAAYGDSFECDICCDTGASAPDERCICTYPDNEPSFEDVVDCNSFNPSHPEGDEPSPEEFDAWDAHLAAGGFSN
tara:strand:- start:317 stop:985 length:669 start_codon:yes stop_codon:yes gene_type:complete